MKTRSLFSVAVLFMGLSTVCHAGSEGGGGGTAVWDYDSWRWTLLDFKAFDRNFDPSVADPMAPNEVIRPSLFSMIAGYDYLPIHQAPGYDLAVSRLNLWLHNAPEVVEMTRIALERMQWIYTPYQQNLCFTDQLPPEIPKESMVSAVVYSRAFGARMSLGTVNALGRVSRAGLLIHEALRHAQVRYNAYLTDKEIYEITSKIMLTDPKPLKYPGNLFPGQLWITEDLWSEDMRSFIEHWHADASGHEVSPSETSAKFSFRRTLDEACYFLEADGHFLQSNDPLCADRKSRTEAFLLFPEGPETNDRYREQVSSLRGGIQKILDAHLPDARDDAEKRRENDRLLYIWNRLAKIQGSVGKADLKPLPEEYLQPKSVFLNMTEAELRQYLDSGDRKGYDRSKQMEIDQAIRDKETRLPCPQN